MDRHLIPVLRVGAGSSRRIGGNKNKRKSKNKDYGRDGRGRGKVGGGEEEGEDGEEDKVIEFNEKCISAMKIMFSWFDSNGDGVLDSFELGNLIQFSKEETLTHEFLEAISECVDTDEDGNVTFKGFQDFYRRKYNDADGGIASGDKTLWKDLSSFGFSTSLKHSGNFPQSTMGKRTRTNNAETSTNTSTGTSTSARTRSRTRAKYGNTPNYSEADDDTKLQTGKGEEWEEAEEERAPKKKKPKRNAFDLLGKSRKTLQDGVAKEHDRKIEKEEKTVTPKEEQALEEAPERKKPRRNAFDLLGKKKKTTLPPPKPPSPKPKRNAFDLLGKKKNPPPASPKASHSSNKKNQRNSKRAKKQPEQGNQKQSKSKNPKPTEEQLQNTADLFAHPTIVDPEKINPFFKPRARVYANTTIDITDSNDDECTIVNDGSATKGKTWILPDFPVKLEKQHVVDVEPIPINWDSFKRNSLNQQTSGQLEGVIDVSTQFEFVSKIDPDNSSSFKRLRMVDPTVTVHDLSQFTTSIQVVESCDIVQSLSNRYRISKESLLTYAKAARPLKKDSTASQLWIDQYRPAYAGEILENSEMIKMLTEWLQNWVRTPKELDEDAPTAAAAAAAEVIHDDDYNSDSNWGPAEEDERPCTVGCRVICGPSGTFKTASVYHAAQKLGFKVFEANPGMERSMTQLKQKFGEATQSKVIANSNALNNSIILIDEADVAFDQDNGYWNWLKTLVDKARCPIIMSCTRLHPKIANMLKEHDEDHVVQLHQMKPPTAVSVRSALLGVCAVQGIEITDAQLDYFVEQNRGDLRKCLNQLQFACDITSIKIEQKDTSVVNLVDVTSPCRPSKAPSSPSSLVSIYKTSLLFDSLFCCTESELHGQMDEFGYHPWLGESDLLENLVESLAAEGSGGDRVSSRNAGSYEPEFPMPKLQAIVPPYGTVSGGNCLYVYGENFECIEEVSEVTVTIDNQPCKRVKVLSDSLLEVISPPRKDGYQLLDVDFSDQLEVEQDDDEEYYDDDNGGGTQKMDCEEGVPGQGVGNLKVDDDAVLTSDEEDLSSDGEEEEEEQQQGGAGATGATGGGERPKTQQLNGKNVKKAQRRTGAYRLARKQFWPSEVNVALKVSRNGKQVVLNSNHDKSNQMANYLFEYQIKRQNYSLTNYLQPKRPAQQDPIPLSSFCENQNRSDTLFEMENILNYQSLIDESCVPGYKKITKAVSIRQPEDYVDESLNKPFVPGTALRANMRSVMYSLVKGMNQKNRDDNQQQAAQKRSSFISSMELWKKQNTYLDRAIAVANCGIGLLGVGPNPFGGRFANSRHVSPCLQDIVPYLVTYLKFYRELERKKQQEEKLGIPRRDRTITITMLLYFDRFKRGLQLQSNLERLPKLVMPC